MSFREGALLDLAIVGSRWGQIVADVAVGRNGGNGHETRWMHGSARGGDDHANGVHLYFQRVRETREIRRNTGSVHERNDPEVELQPGLEMMGMVLLVDRVVAPLAWI